MADGQRRRSRQEATISATSSHTAAEYDAADTCEVFYLSKNSGGSPTGEHRKVRGSSNECRRCKGRGTAGAEGAP